MSIHFRGINFHVIKENSEIRKIYSPQKLRYQQGALLLSMEGERAYPDSAPFRKKGRIPTNGSQ